MYCKKGNILNTALWDFYNVNNQVTKKRLIDTFLNLKNNYCGKRQKIRCWNNSRNYLENHTKLSFIWDQMKDRLIDCNWCICNNCKILVGSPLFTYCPPIHCDSIQAHFHCIDCNNKVYDGEEYCYRCN